MAGTHRPGQRRRARLTATGLYLILTAPGNDPDAAAVFEPALAAALGTSCVGMLQLRAPEADKRTIGHWIERLRPLCHRWDVLLLLNDHVGLAASLDLDGAHVGQDDLAVAQARTLLGPERILGLSTHDAREIEAGCRLPVDYLGLGPCYATTSKDLSRTPQGPALVARCVPLAGDVPVFPIGGIDAANADALAAAGAGRLAVGAGVLAAADPAAAARRLAGILAGRHPERAPD